MKRGTDIVIGYQLSVRVATQPFQLSVTPLSGWQSSNCLNRDLWDSRIFRKRSGIGVPSYRCKRTGTLSSIGHKLKVCGTEKNDGKLTFSMILYRLGIFNFSKINYIIIVVSTDFCETERIGIHATCRLRRYLLPLGSVLSVVSYQLKRGFVCRKPLVTDC